MLLLEKKYEELCSRTRDLTRSITNSKPNNSDNYDEKYMKIKFNSDNELPLKKTLEFNNVIIIVRPDVGEGNKYSPQVFLNKSTKHLLRTKTNFLNEI